MATNEDFTFPIFTDPISCSIDSPPLWCLSPDQASPDHYHEETSKESSTEGEESDQEEESYKDCFPTEPTIYLAPRKSLSSIEELGAAAISNLVRRNSSRNDDKEEKMDMLWEDFNTEERLTRSHSSSRLDTETVSMGCVEALSMSKPNNGTAIFSPRKPGLVVFMRVMKRFFLLHNSQKSVNKHHSSYRPVLPSSPAIALTKFQTLPLSFPFQTFMGVIDIYNTASSLCLIKSNNYPHQALVPQRPTCSFQRNSNQRRVVAMTSSVPVEHVKEVQQNVTGDSFIRSHLRKLSPYQSILPFEILSAQLGRKPEDIVKLDANENPYGPPPEASLIIVLEALGTLKFPYIYPDPESRRLREALAIDSGLESDHILVGCGADELIDLIMRCTLDPGDKIVDCPPTFTMYEFDAAVNGALVTKVLRKPDFSLNVELIVDAVRQEKPKCIFLTSPNNPDGSIINDEDLLKILELPILVVLDEAYIEFSGQESRMKWVKKHDNLIVLRTFSKRAGLAGLRVGYGAFPLSIIEYLWRAKQPYNVSVAAEVAACAALQNPTYLENVKNALVEERERLFKFLQEVPFLTPFPSHSNFVLCEVKSGMDAKKLKDDLASMGVMVRHYNKKELKGFIRVSVGKPEQTDKLMHCLKRLS
ncbi:hypothetical protein SADUNF_Sadunf13G0090800 [Salix dunnii]|uniref:histidinol-phosphate transaminase n=1 Tax=Salix dunnii TaxID=1413687 RepID=A0A835JLJ6_9ROSI|nr:hypothetical protein SADUNF_Sadunf13G0090800 [Salix dunnii]